MGISNDHVMFVTAGAPCQTCAYAPIATGEQANLVKLIREPGASLWRVSSERRPRQRHRNVGAHRGAVGTYDYTYDGQGQTHAMRSLVPVGLVPNNTRPYMSNSHLR